MLSRAQMRVLELLAQPFVIDMTTAGLEAQQRTMIILLRRKWVRITEHGPFSFPHLTHWAITLAGRRALTSEGRDE